MLNFDSVDLGTLRRHTQAVNSYREKWLQCLQEAFKPQALRLAEFRCYPKEDCLENLETILSELTAEKKTEFLALISPILKAMEDFEMANYPSRDLSSHFQFLRSRCQPDFPFKGPFYSSALVTPEDVLNFARDALSIPVVQVSTDGTPGPDAGWAYSKARLLALVFRGEIPGLDEAYPPTDAHLAGLGMIMGDFAHLVRLIGAPSNEVAALNPKEPPAEFPIILGEPDDSPIVRGKEKKRLTSGQFRVVKALVDAHPDRLSKDVLVNRSKTEDPVKMIDRLRKDKDWASVLDKPGQPHGGYGIRVKKPRKPTPRKG